MSLRDTFDTPLRGTFETPLHGGPAAHPGQSGGLYAAAGKRALDLALVGLTLPVWLPIVLALMALAACDGAAPLYRQERLGRGVRVFRMLKIRTMIPGAEAALARHLAADPAARREWQTNQKLRRDPRVTALGRVLRRSSLDELPQLFNVLAGDMSLVGPRPMMPEQRALYPGRAAFALRPGLTGPWQVSARHETGFAARAGFDAAYLAGLSLRGDLALLGRTAGAVLRGTGC